MRNLRKLRLQRKLTQKGLSIKSGVSQAYINELENGKKINPSVFILSKLALALDTTVSELLDDEMDTGELFSVREEIILYRMIS